MPCGCVTFTMFVAYHTVLAKTRRYFNIHFAFHHDFYTHVRCCACQVCVYTKLSFVHDNLMSKYSCMWEYKRVMMQDGHCHEDHVGD